MLTPSPGSVFIVLHSSAPPAPALYWITVSIAGHFFFSTICWWRADRSDSPPGGNACQYMRLLSGQGWAWAWATAVASTATVSANKASGRMCMAVPLGAKAALATTVQLVIGCTVVHPGRPA
jgi:hypothetical protein